MVSWVFNLLPRLAFGVRTYDAGSVKLMRREVLTDIPVISRSPFSEAERLIRASRAGYRIGVVPVDFSPRTSGESNAIRKATLILAMQDVCRVWWDLHVCGRRRARLEHGVAQRPHP
jgi:hypothetical protein